VVYKQILSGRYVLRRPIASGGQASVWSADDRRLGRAVAVKVVSPDVAARKGVIDRFRREALAAAALVHPNIAQVYDSGRDNGTYYIVMELLEGGSLRDLESKRPLDQTEAAIVGRAVARALSYAHTKGILHRDVKPSNVLFTQTGFPKLADFGIARSLESEDGELTSDGELVGTLSYMAPEQLSGQKATEASDIYCLGLILYEVLTGENPRAGRNLAELHRLASSTLPPISTKLAALDPEVARLIDACVSINQSSRPTSAAEIAEILSPYCLGRTELDLSTFGTRDGDSTVVAPASPPSLSRTPTPQARRTPSTAESGQPMAPPPQAAERPPGVPSTDIRPLASVLRAGLARSVLRVVVGLAVSTACALAGFYLGNSASAALVQLLPSGIPLLKP
jgi:serine/threonine protein kinase